MSTKSTDKVFNYKKSDYHRPSIFLGEDPGYLDSIHHHFPKIWDLYGKIRSMDWSFDEMDLSPLLGEFKSADRSTYEMMLLNLIYQFGQDSVASRCIGPVMAPFISSSEYWAACQRQSDQESIHAFSYSEIIRNSFDDPAKVIDDLGAIEEVQDRMHITNQAIAEGFRVGHLYALGEVGNNQGTYNAAMKTLFAIYLFEKICFSASFAVTASLHVAGRFIPAGRLIQKIATDEIINHAALDRVTLLYAFESERGMEFYDTHKGLMQDMILEVIESERRWVEFLFKDGRELVGVTPKKLLGWTLWCARQVVEHMGLELDPSVEWPDSNPMKFMDQWLNPLNIQESPQEEDKTNYRVNILEHDDNGEVFATDF